MVVSWSIMNRRQIVAGGCGLSTSVLVTSTMTAKDHAWPALAVEPATTSDDLVNTFQAGPRGLQYKILKQGEGDSPRRGQQVFTKYTLWTGGFGEKQVDSNTGFLGKPLPVIVGIGRVIKGWDLTLLDMKVGEIRRIIVPSDLGYGDRGAGGAIPPKATLYFEVEMTGMDPLPQLTDAQKQWLEENPL
jgi:FKBP-type peptidyl-prolyl cis-trans isomerase